MKGRRAFCLFMGKITRSGCLLAGALGVVQQGPLPDFGQGGLAEDVLGLAGVLGGGLFVHPQLHEEVGQQTVAAVDPLGNLLARGQKRQIALAVHRNVAVFPQLFHGDADAGLGVAQLIDNVDGAHLALALGEHQDGFQIIFCGLVDDHDGSASLFSARRADDCYKSTTTRPLTQDQGPGFGPAKGAFTGWPDRRRGRTGTGRPRRCPG